MFDFAGFRVRLALATVALIVILLRDGLEVDGEIVRSNWHLPARKLVAAMPLTAGPVAVATKLLIGLSWTEAFLVGALLSPTDPVLSSNVVTNPRGAGDRARFPEPRIGVQRRAGAAGGTGAGRSAGTRQPLRASGGSSARTSGSGSVVGIVSRC